MATDALTRTVIAQEDSGVSIDNIIDEFAVIYENINKEINKSDVDYDKMTKEEFIEVLGRAGICETHQHYQSLLYEYESDHMNEFENYDDAHTNYSGFY